MFKKTTVSEAKKIASSWRGSYFCKKGEWLDENKKNIYDNLLALGDNPNPEQVNTVIGNKSWTRLTCDECSKDVDTVVQCGQESDYDSSTAELCIDCIKKAFELIDK